MGDIGVISGVGCDAETEQQSGDRIVVVGESGVIVLRLAK